MVREARGAPAAMRASRPPLPSPSPAPAPPPLTPTAPARRGAALPAGACVYACMRANGASLTRRAAAGRRDRRRRCPQLPTDITPLTMVGPAFIAGIIALMMIGYLMSVIKAASRVRASRSARPRARLFFF